MKFLKNIYDWIFLQWIAIQDSMELAKSAYRHKCDGCGKKDWFINRSEKPLQEREHLCLSCHKNKYPYSFVCFHCEQKFYTNEPIQDNCEGLCTNCEQHYQSYECIECKSVCYSEENRIVCHNCDNAINNTANDNPEQLQGKI